MEVNEKGQKEIMEFGSLLQKLRDTPPEFCPYQSSLNNVSAGYIARRQNPYFRQAILHTDSRKLMADSNRRNGIMRPPKDMLGKTANYKTDISVPCILIIPPKKCHVSMISHLEELLDNNDPFVTSLMVRIWHSVRPSNAWTLEKDPQKLVYAINKLSFDLILHRHNTGNCIRYKALSVILAGKQNPILQGLLESMATLPGNWLDCIIRSGLSTFASCRFESAICMLSFVTDREFMKKVCMKGVRPLLTDVFNSLFRLADMFEDTSTVFFVVMAYMVCHNEQQLLLDAILRCGPTARTEFLMSHWPYLVAFVYTYWSRRRLLMLTLRDSVLMGALNEAWRNPISRRGAREAMKAVRQFVETVSPFSTQWPIKQKRTPMVHAS